MLRLTLVSLVLTSGCSAIVGSTLDRKRDGGPHDGATDASMDLGDLGHDAGDMGSDSGPPCPTACGMHATCNAAMHVCQCDMGYAMGTGADCVDVNECTAGTSTCDATAICENTPGSFLCHCRAGATGDGMTCTAPTVLVLLDPNTSGGTADTASMTGVMNAVTRADATPTITNDPAAFATMLASGTWSAVVVSWINTPTIDTIAAPLMTYIGAGGNVIIAHWQLATSAALMGSLGVTGTAYTGAADVVTDTVTTPDLFDQHHPVPSTITPHVSMFYTEGQRLTPSGAGAFSVATLSGGGSAIVIANNGHTITNGFTFNEAINAVTPDADGDGLNDASELLTNELDYLLRPHVLVYWDYGPVGPQEIPVRAVGGVRMTAFTVRTGADFDRVYDRAGFDYMLVDSSSNTVSPTNQTRISAWSATIGRTIFSYWELAGMISDTTVLRAALAVGTTASPLVPFHMLREVDKEPTSPVDLFTFDRSFPSPLVGMDVGFGIHGDELTPSDPTTSFVAAHFDSPTGPSAILVTRSGKTIVNGFLSPDYVMTDGNANMVPDVQELYANELLYLFTRP